MFNAKKCLPASLGNSLQYLGPVTTVNNKLVHFFHIPWRVLLVNKTFWFLQFAFLYDALLACLARYYCLQSLKQRLLENIVDMWHTSCRDYLQEKGPFELKIAFLKVTVLLSYLIGNRF